MYNCLLRVLICMFVCCFISVCAHLYCTVRNDWSGGIDVHVREIPVMAWISMIVRGLCWSERLYSGAKGSIFVLRWQLCGFSVCVHVTFLRFQFPCSSNTSMVQCLSSGQTLCCERRLQARFPWILYWPVRWDCQREKV